MTEVYQMFGNGVRTITEYDRASGLMKSRQAGIGGGTGLINAALEWDLNGNMIQRKELNLNVTEGFYYDALDRFEHSVLTPAVGAPFTKMARRSVTRVSTCQM